MLSFVFFINILLITKTRSLVEITKLNKEHLVTSGIKDSNNSPIKNIQFGPENATDTKESPKTSPQHNELYKNDSKLSKLIPMEFNNTSNDIIGAINEFINEDLRNVTSENNTVLNNGFYNLVYLKSTYTTNNTNPNKDENFKPNLEKDDDSNYRMNNSIMIDSLESNESYWVPQETRRIYKGERTKIKYYPFMASVQMFGTFMCAGSIIGEDLIITAASCLQLAWNNRFFRENPAYLSVRVGSNFYSSGGEVIPVLEVYFHPGYDPKTLNNNLAIMRLDRVLCLKKKKHVRKIRIDREEQSLAINTRGVKILGWGAKTASNKIQDPYKNILSYDRLDIYPLYMCKEVYSKEYLKHTNFCAGFLSKGGGACNRDVGGPGIVNGILVGVISFGSPVCGGIDAPTVFTKLGYYYDWIEEIIKKPVKRYRIGTTTTSLPTLFPNREPRTTTQAPLTPIFITKKKYYWYTDTENTETILRSPNNDDEVLRAIKTLLKRDYVVVKKSTTTLKGLHTTAAIPIVDETTPEAVKQVSIESLETSKETNEKSSTIEDKTDEHIDFLIKELEKVYDLNLSELDLDEKNDLMEKIKETTANIPKFTAISEYSNDNLKDTQKVHKTHRKNVFKKKKKTTKSKNQIDDQNDNVTNTKIKIAALDEKSKSRKQERTELKEDSLEITIGDDSSDYGMDIFMDSEYHNK